MSTILNAYINLQQTMAPRAEGGVLSTEELMLYQELLYRIDVLSTIRAFCKTAPITTEINVLSSHYKLVDAYIQCMTSERKIGAPANDALKEQRATGGDSLNKIVHNSRKTFSSFCPTSQEQYKQNIGSMISAILSIWVPYRNTYININL